MELNVADGDSSKIPIVASSQDDIDEVFKQMKELNFEYLLGSDGKIIKQSQIYNWLTKINKSDDKLADNIRMEQIFPLYKILDDELQYQVEIVLKNRLDTRILLTGFTTINMDDDNLNEIHIRINFEEHLNDDCFHVFGHVVDDDHNKLESIVERFDLFDYYGFSAFLTLNQNMKKWFA